MADAATARVSSNVDTESHIRRVLGVLLGADGQPVTTRAIATTLALGEEWARGAVKACIESGWARREKQHACITDRGRLYASACKIQPQAVVVHVAPVVPIEDARPYKERRAAELLAGGFSRAEVAAILKMPASAVARISPKLAPQRVGALVTDSSGPRGARPSGPARIEDFIRSGDSSSIGW